MSTVPQQAGADAGTAGLAATRPRSAFRRGLEVFLENKLAVPAWSSSWPWC